MAESEQKLLRQILKEIVDEYGYSQNQIGRKVKISDRFEADCVIYSDQEKKRPLIVIEIKSRVLYPLEVDQLATYMRMTNSKYGMLTNGVERFYYRLVGKEMIEVSDIPRRGEKEVRTLEKRKLKPIRHLDYRLQTIYDRISRSEKIPPENILNEVQKLLMCKLEDEKSPKEMADFWISPKEAEEFEKKETQEKALNRINRIFTRVKTHFPQIYSRDEGLKLSPRTLFYCISQLQNYSLTRAPYDVISSDYPGFIRKSMYGYLGQYFTAKPLVDFMVKMLDPSKEERVLDPAVGSGGFLISVIHHIFKEPSTLSAKANYARNKIFGIDINPRMVSICKMNMLLQGDGHGNIFLADFLSDLSSFEELQPQSYDIIITDPPFGDVISDQKILRSLEFGEGRKSQRIHVLFLEKCINMLKPGGRMAVVVPESFLTSPSLHYARNFLLKKTVIRAIISLPAQTFISYSGMKTSVIVLQKREETRRYEDYDVFSAEALDVTEETLDEIVKSYQQFMKKV